MRHKDSIASERWQTGDDRTDGHSYVFSETGGVAACSRAAGWPALTMYGQTAHLDWPALESQQQALEGTTYISCPVQAGCTVGPGEDPGATACNDGTPSAYRIPPSSAVFVDGVTRDHRARGAEMTVR